MTKILINEPGSYLNLPKLKEICKQHNWTLKEVSINYDTVCGLPFEEETDKWPFKAIFEESGLLYKVCILTLAVGYSGAGPTDLASILDFLNVQYDEKDIYTKRSKGEDDFIRLQYVL